MAASALDVDIDGVTGEYAAAIQSFKDAILDEIVQINKKQLNVYEETFKENSMRVEQMAIINETIDETREKLKCRIETIKSSQKLIQSHHDRIKVVNDKCDALEAEIKKLQRKANKNKLELTQLSNKEQKSIKKINKEIKLFESGVHHFQQCLQLKMDFGGDNIHNNRANIYVQNRNNYNIYKVIVDNDSGYKLIDIVPKDPHACKAVDFYNENKDIQGMFAFLRMFEE